MMEDEDEKVQSVWPGMVGGRYQPLSQHDMERIHQTTLEMILNSNGLGLQEFHYTSKYFRILSAVCTVT